MLDIAVVHLPMATMPYILPKTQDLVGLVLLALITPMAVTLCVLPKV
jgi:hypothetical protein